MQVINYQLDQVNWHFAIVYIFTSYFLIFIIFSFNKYINQMKHTKRLNHKRKSVQKEPTVKSCLLNLDWLKATNAIGQRKAFYRQRIPHSSCARKDTIEFDIHVTSKNGDRKIMQSIRITRRPPSRIRKLNQFRWTSKFRRWVKLSRETVSEGPTVVHIRFCSLSNNSK